VVQKIFQSYTRLLDEKLENSTVIVLVISWLIVLVGVIIPDTVSAEREKANIFESSHIKKYENVIIIDGEEYIIQLTKKEL